MAAKYLSAQWTLRFSLGKRSLPISRKEEHLPINDSLIHITVWQRWSRTLASNLIGMLVDERLTCSCYDSCIPFQQILPPLPCFPLERNIAMRISHHAICADAPHVFTWRTLTSLLLPIHSRHLKLFRPSRSRDTTTVVQADCPGSSMLNQQSTPHPPDVAAEGAGCECAPIVGDVEATARVGVGFGVGGAATRDTMDVFVAVTSAESAETQPLNAASSFTNHQEGVSRSLPLIKKESPRFRPAMTG